jgi:hypothetical protein
MQDLLTRLIINVFSVILIVIGFVEIIFWKKISKYAVDRWYKDLKIRINKAVYVVVVLVTGVLFVFVGMSFVFYIH